MMCLVPREEYVQPFQSWTSSCFLSPRSANVIHSSVTLPELGISVGNVLCPGFLEMPLSAFVCPAGGRSAGLLLEGSSIWTTSQGQLSGSDPHGEEFLGHCGEDEFGYWALPRGSHRGLGCSFLCSVTLHKLNAFLLQHPSPSVCLIFNSEDHSDSFFPCHSCNIFAFL